ncbi:MAG: hypothetical protein HRU18_26945 [Pseudoalteromonas sp.]|uniref:hypothetical protein n=1 Tax=Pseudoalteromonas sp. TaxID=53249 RepID=UPI001DE23402|nr:hypothetical protein [Pseudoalteromonas sp.]NRA81851.1 hypothetical protein [Pseudoalteromonas sp.]
MKFITPATSNAQTGVYFTTKRVGIQSITPLTPPEEGDVCRCLRQCIRPLPAFTDEDGGDLYKNDLYSQYINTLTGGTVEIEIFKNGVSLGLVTDNTYGIRFEDTTNNYAGYVWVWFKVWQTSGYGNYYFVIRNKNGAGTVKIEEISPTFTLKKYTERAAHGTVRIETVQKGKLKHWKNYVAPVWAQQIRFYGSLKLTGNVIENDKVVSSLDTRKSIQIKDQLRPEYELQLIMPGAESTFSVLYDYLFAETVLVSDYNIFNFVHQPNLPGAQNYRSIPLKRTGTEFTPSRKARRKTFNIAMEYDYDNVFKINC